MFIVTEYAALKVKQGMSLLVQNRKTNIVNLNEMDHHEPSYLNQHCLQTISDSVF